MKPKSWLPAGLLLAVAVAAMSALWWAPGRQAKAAADVNPRQSLHKGDVGYQSLGALSFDRSGLLLIADSAAGAVYAVDLPEKRAAAHVAYNVPKLATLLAARLGTTPDQIILQDLAVSPVSRRPYVTVQRKGAAGPDAFALFRIEPSGKATPMSLKSVAFAKAALPRDGGELPRITDLAVAGDRVLIGTVSKERFNSKMITLPWPLKAEGGASFSTQIYHTSHRRLETNSPIRTLIVADTPKGEEVFGALICTPVVRLPVSEIKPGGMLKGQTVVELGSRNRPLQMIAYGKNAQSLLINNSAFGLLKVGSDYLSRREPINQQAAHRPRDGELDGVQIIKSPGKVALMDKLDGQRFLMVLIGAGGERSLVTADLP